jgi:hypothetical protein
MQAHDAEHAVGGLLDRDECHRAGVIELREFADALIGQLMDRSEEAQPQIFPRQVCDELRIITGVQWPQRTHQHARAVRQHVVMRQCIEVDRHGRLYCMTVSEKPDATPHQMRGRLFPIMLFVGASSVNATSGSAPSSTTGCRGSRRRG